MKTNYYVVALATIVLGLAGFAYAQGGYFNAEEGNGKWGAEPTVSPAYNGYAYFNPETANSAPLTAAQDTASALATPNDAPAPQGRFYGAEPEHTAPAVHYGKTGKLHLKRAVSIAGGTLKRGDYYVRFVDSPDGHYVEFSKTVINHFAQEGQSPYEDKVIAEIPCTMEQLNAAVARTEFLPKTDKTVARLEIRGEKVAHLF